MSTRGVRFVEPSRDDLLDRLDSVKYERNQLREEIKLLQDSAYERRSRDRQNLNYVEAHRNDLLNDFQKLSVENKDLKDRNSRIARERDDLARHVGELNVKLHEASRGYACDGCHSDMNESRQKGEERLDDVIEENIELRDLYQKEHEALEEAKRDLNKLSQEIYRNPKKFQRTVESKRIYQLEEQLQDAYAKKSEADFYLKISEEDRQRLLRLLNGYVTGGPRYP